MKKIYNEDYYMYRLCNIKGIGRASVRKLVDFFGSAYNVSKADINILKKSGILNGRQIDEFAFSMKNKDNIYKYEDMIKNGCNWISINNNNYPERLHNIDDAPLGVYCRGNLPPDDRLSVAIIGSRNCSSYGRRMAYNLAESFAADNIQVISGLASGGYTYAVLGCGTDVCYPYENLDIYKNIIKTGGVISEYPPNTRPDAWRFPERNRIISGLADIVIVVEAAQRSGAMITVDQALEQNREVMAVPGRADDICSQGCNELIKTGAMVITKPEDIWQCSAAALWKEKNKINKHTNTDIKALNGGNGNKKPVCPTANLLATEKKLVYSVLCLHPKDTDEIINETGLNVSTVMQTLLLLQLEGCVEEVAKNCYIRIK